ncbi:hypothetical protein Pcinc_017719 [Petrolisthes cinctipes]|uniref:Uncharacterized protein n=1 Tax=Petrolisthes cinctipes TaxID=88211 RepID=A0AAE1FNN8_PETCI|nr:hypothetical protein Pcinc_017719 [Petrolisthes cinctipes]
MRKSESGCKLGQGHEKVTLQSPGHNHQVTHHTPNASNFSHCIRKQGSEERGGEERRGEERRGEERRGEERKGEERRGEDRRGEDRRKEERRGEKRIGEKRRGEERRGDKRRSLWVRSEALQIYIPLHPGLYKRVVL